MTDTKKPNAKNYIECPECSKEQGEPVLYHKSVLKTKEPLFGDAYLECPEGHEMPTTVPA